MLALRVSMRRLGRHFHPGNPLCVFSQDAITQCVEPHGVSTIKSHSIAYHSAAAGLVDPVAVCKSLPQSITACFCHSHGTHKSASSVPRVASFETHVLSVAPELPAFFQWELGQWNWAWLSGRVIVLPLHPIDIVMRTAAAVEAFIARSTALAANSVRRTIA